MQVNSVPFVNLADTRDASNVATPDDAELKAQGSSIAAVSSPNEGDGSGRQSEQKPSDQPASNVEFTEQELKQIRKLESRDREVRAHEQAHQSVGGQYAGAASYTYQRGPDGVNYAIGGEVPIDAGKIQGNPEATIQKAEVVRRAALAPAEPSSQDRRVAALAAQVKLEAQAELASIRAEEAQAGDESEETRSDADASQSESSNNDGGEFAEQSVAQSQSTNNEDAESSSTDGTSERDDSESATVTVSDGALSPQDFVNLLASDIARKNAMAVFENINREPPKGNLDELV